MPKEKSRPSSQSQLDRFKQAARDLECDDDPEAFKRVMEKIAKAKTPTAGKRRA